MLKGLIINARYNGAEYMKIMIEKAEDLNAKVDVLEEQEEVMRIIDTKEYDFVMTSVMPVTEDDFKERIIPLFDIYTARDRHNYLRLEFPKEVLYIDRTNIVGLEVMGKQCYVHTEKTIYKIGRITMNKLIELLDDPNIVRCHKSFAVNLKYVRGFRKESRNRWSVLFLIDTDFDCLVSDGYMKRLTETISDIKVIKSSIKLENGRK